MAKRDQSNQVDPGTRCFTFMRLKDEKGVVILEGILVSATCTDPNFKPRHEYWYWYSKETTYTTSGKNGLKLERSYGDVSGKDADPARDPDLVEWRPEQATWGQGPKKPHLWALEENKIFGLSLDINFDDKSKPPFALHWFNTEGRNLFTGLDKDRVWIMSSTEPAGAPKEWYSAAT